MTSTLFSPLTLRGLTLRNRIAVSPMCQYSSQDGFASDWHLVHIGARAVGGAALIVMEATAVAPEGRITPACLGLWKDEHIQMLERICAFAKTQGAAIGIQLAHAGRKASMDIRGKRLLQDEGGWTTVAPSPLPFLPEHAPPHELSVPEIEKLKADFISAALRAVKAGFQVIEIHGAHGYLLHEFLSPLSNKRTDAYGKDRRLLLKEIATGMRKAVPDHIVIGVRLSCVDWVEGGLQIEDSVETARQLKALSVDFIDCSSGALTADAKIPAGPGYQVPFARAIRAQAGISAAAVGFITQAQQAENILKSGDADFVFLAREMLRDPYFPIHAAKELGAEAPVPLQYARAY